MRRIISIFCLPIFLMISTSASGQDYSVYHAHPYPICFYDTASGAVKESRQIWATYPKTLISVVNLKPRKWTGVEIINSHLAIIRTTMNHHRELLNLWPEVACIGEKGGDTSDRLNRICRKHISNFIKAEISHVAFDEENAPICQLFKPE